MWQFICGFCGGIYVGTYFECKPTLEKVVDFVKTSLPDKKDEESSEKGKGQAREYVDIITVKQNVLLIENKERLSFRRIDARAVYGIPTARWADDVEGEFWVHIFDERIGDIL